MSLKNLSVASLKIKPKILISVLSPLLLLIALGGVSYVSIASILETSRWVQHTYKVLASAEAIIANAVDMETGMRGYLLAGQEEFLEPYNNGEVATYAAIAQLRETVSDNPAQMERLDRVEATLQQWQSDVTGPMIALRREIGDAKTMNDMAKLVGEARGKLFFDKFREQIALFIQREADLLVERRAQFEAAKSAVVENFGTVTNTIGWVEHTNNVLQAAKTILANAVDMETGMRGFLLAGQDEFLEPYDAGQQAFFINIAALKETVSDNPPQVQRLNDIEALIREWIQNVTEPVIAQRREVVAGTRSLLDIESTVQQKAGKQYFDTFRGLIAEFSDIERGLMVERQQAADAAQQAVADNIASMEENEAWVSHTYAVISNADAILAAAVDMETGMRGYLLAGQENFLEPYNAGREVFFERVASLRETVSDNPPQVELLHEIEATITGWTTEVTEPTIALRREIGDAKTMDDMADLVGEARGKVFFDAFRALMAEFSAEEQSLMEVRRAASEQTVSTTNIAIVATVVGGLIAGTVFAWFVGGGIAGPISRMTAAMQQLARGNNSVDIPGVHRSDEIGDMAGTVQIFKENAIEKDRMEAEQAELKVRAEQEKRQAQLKMADELERSVKSAIQVIATSASDMKGAAEGMAGTAEETSERATMVASATEEASTNVQTVAAASEELSSSISEISRQVQSSRTVTEQAQETSSRATETIQNLATNAERVGDVIKLINDIAEQTNL
ncbi:MAG: CHASE3 domain-containing protein, partial [Pseudomonadota bacterium]